MKTDNSRHTAGTPVPGAGPGVFFEMNALAKDPQSDTLMGAKEQKTAVSARLQHLLHRASQQADAMLGVALSELNITPRQLAVLDEVLRTPGICQGDVGTRTGMDRSTLSDLVIRLMKNGYITRRRSRRDARAFTLQITPKGMQVVEAAAPAAERVSSRLLATLPREQRDEFGECLRVLIEKLK